MKFSEHCVKFCKIGAKVLKNQRNLEWCKGKNVDLVSFQTIIYYLLAKIGFDTAENDPLKVCQKMNFLKISQKLDKKLRQP